MQSYTGSGPYFFDVSAGMAKGSGLSMTTDGVWQAGVVGLGATVDTLSDPEQVTVTAGPVDLYISAANFTDGQSTWLLSDQPGPDKGGAWLGPN